MNPWLQDMVPALGGFQPGGQTRECYCRVGCALSSLGAAGVSQGERPVSRDIFQEGSLLVLKVIWEAEKRAERRVLGGLQAQSLRGSRGSAFGRHTRRRPDAGQISVFGNVLCSSKALPAILPKGTVI